MFQDMLAMSNNAESSGNNEVYVSLTTMCCANFKVADYKKIEIKVEGNGTDYIYLRGGNTAPSMSGASVGLHNWGTLIKTYNTMMSDFEDIMPLTSSYQYVILVAIRTNYATAVHIKTS